MNVNPQSSQDRSSDFELFEELSKKQTWALEAVFAPAIDMFEDHQTTRQSSETNPSENGTTSPFFFMKSAEGTWDAVAEGLSAKVLYADEKRSRTSMLLRIEAGSTFPGHAHHGPEELYMLEGDCLCEGETLGPGDYHRVAGGSDHGLTSTVNGCLMFISAPEIEVFE